MHRRWVVAGLVPALVFGALLPLAAEDTAPAANPHALVKTSMGDFELELFKQQAPKTVANFLDLANGTKAWKNAKGEMVRKPFFDGLAFHRVIDGFMIQGGCPKGDGTGDAGYLFEDEINAKALGLDKIKFFENGMPHKWAQSALPSQQVFNAKIIVPLLEKLGHDPATIPTLSPADQAKLNGEVKTKLFSMSLMEAYELMGYKYDDKLRSSPPKKGVIAMANSGPNTNGSQFFVNLADTDHLTGKHTVFGRVVKGFEVVEKIGKVKVDKRTNRPLEPVRILSVRAVAAKGER